MPSFLKIKIIKMQELAKILVRRENMIARNDYLPKAIYYL